jgi:hypothetical protein
MRRWIDRPTWLALLAAVAATALVIAARAAPIAVEVVNASEPTLCAEKDNVYLQLRSAEVRHHGRGGAPCLCRNHCRRPLGAGLPQLRYGG